MQIGQEVILVDNNSNDKTVKKAKQFNISKVVNIKKFLPGKAINMGIENSRGDYIVILSAHAIPTNNLWLENFVSRNDIESFNFVTPDVRHLIWDNILDKIYFEQFVKDIIK